ncbi:MAG: hypothetical protein M0Z36_14650 [Thermaerobacter sp.]|nr:hypothetical protein [Thermaerobacter sp.]
MGFGPHHVPQHANRLVAIVVDHREQMGGGYLCTLGQEAWFGGFSQRLSCGPLVIPHMVMGLNFDGHPSKRLEILRPSWLQPCHRAAPPYARMDGSECARLLALRTSSPAVLRHPMDNGAVFSARGACPAVRVGRVSPGAAALEVK